jgi:hypothetical protein
MSEAKTVTAQFHKNYELTVLLLPHTEGAGSLTSSPAGIYCCCVCGASFEAGTTVTVHQTTYPGWEFLGWSGACTGIGPCEVLMTEAKSVTPDYRQLGSWWLSVSKTGSGTGTVISNPDGISCGSNCEWEYTEGSVVRLEAFSAPGSEFAGWGGACTGTGACEVTMNKAQAVGAAFNASGGSSGGGGSGSGGGSSGAGSGSSSGDGSPPSAAPAPTPTKTSTSKSGTVTLAGVAIVKTGAAVLKLACSPIGPCKGKLDLMAKLKSGGKTGPVKKIGTASFSLAAKTSTTLKVKLSSQARKILADGQALKATVSGSGLRSRAIKLRPS